jgi:hypothetical protein
MRIGEIIESSSTRFVAESFELNQPPLLGSLVEVRIGEGRDLYGVVCYGETGGLDRGRRAVRRSSDEVYDEQIYQESPQLKHTLRTEFESLSVGMVEGGVIRQCLPSQPPPLHFSVHSCGFEETMLFTENLYYFRLLLGASGPVPAEQLLAANVRQVYKERGEEEEWLKRAAREVAKLLKQDYERLMTVLYAIEPAG